MTTSHQQTTPQSAAQPRAEMLIDRYMPDFDFTRVETVVVDAPPEVAYDAARHLDLMRVHSPLSDAATWLRLATGALTWDQAVAEGKVSASGNRADLAAHLPLRPLSR